MGARKIHDPEPDSLCPSALAALRELVLEAGGVTEAEAALLLRVLQKLRELQDCSGAPAAAEAARQIKAIWLRDAGPKEHTLAGLLH